MPPGNGEDYAVLNWNVSGEWNDWDHTRSDYTTYGPIDGIAEYTSNPDVPEPSTCAIWSLLAAIGMTSWRRNRRRTPAA